jgi:DNA-binding transcriptional ArsR family regulator
MHSLPGNPTDDATPSSGRTASDAGRPGDGAARGGGPARPHTHPTGPDHYQVAAEVLALLADRTRLALLHALSAGEADVSTLARGVDAARPSVSQHLARLRLAGLVTTRKEGRRVVYGLSDGHLHRLVAEALNLADHRLHGTGHDG